MVGSFGVGELTVGVKLAAGVAGCAGKVLAVVGAVCAVGGGDLAAAGPVSAGCVGRVEGAAVEVLGGVVIVPIDGSGCLGRWNCSYFSNCLSHHARAHGSSECGGGSSGSSSSLEM